MLLNRKPVPGYTPASAAYIPPTYDSSLQPRYPTEQRTHSRSRTNSSAVIPPTMAQTSVMPPVAYGMPQQLTPHMHPQVAQYADRAGQRQPSNAASFTSASNIHNPNLALNNQRTSTMSGYSTVSDVRRSTSSRSNSSSASPSSYVALMRKQKATVWCDRAQLEDPRILAAQRQAKMRAVAEVAGGNNHAHARVSSSSAGMVGGVRSKIRHHGAPKASAYSGANLAGAVGVPMRLSASEVDENDSDDDQSSTGHRYHSRTGSGRSSLGSGRKNTFSNSQLHHTYSHGGTPPQGLQSPVDSRTTLEEEDGASSQATDWSRRESTTEEQTPMPRTEGDDYFTQHSGDNGASSGNSGDSGHSRNSFSEENFGTLAGLSQHHKGRLPPPEEQIARKQYTAEELRRRGSVDDRTTTMTGAGRLFVANPDLDN